MSRIGEGLFDRLPRDMDGISNFEPLIQSEIKALADQGNQRDREVADAKKPNIANSETLINMMRKYDDLQRIGELSPDKIEQLIKHLTEDRQKSREDRGGKKVIDEGFDFLIIMLNNVKDEKLKCKENGEDFAKTELGRELSELKQFQTSLSEKPDRTKEASERCKQLKTDISTNLQSIYGSNEHGDQLVKYNAYRNFAEQQLKGIHEQVQPVNKVKEDNDLQQAMKIVLDSEKRYAAEHEKNAKISIVKKWLNKRVRNLFDIVPEKQGEVKLSFFNRFKKFLFKNTDIPQVKSLKDIMLEELKSISQYDYNKYISMVKKIIEQEGSPNPQTIITRLKHSYEQHFKELESKKEKYNKLSEDQVLLQYKYLSIAYTLGSKEEIDKKVGYLEELKKLIDDNYGIDQNTSKINKLIYTLAVHSNYEIDINNLKDIKKILNEIQETERSISLLQEKVNDLKNPNRLQDVNSLINIYKDKQLSINKINELIPDQYKPEFVKGYISSELLDLNERIIELNFIRQETIDKNYSRSLDAILKDNSVEINNLIIDIAAESKRQVEIDTLEKIKDSLNKIQNIEERILKAEERINSGESTSILDDTEELITLYSSKKLELNRIKELVPEQYRSQAVKKYINSKNLGLDKKIDELSIEKQQELKRLGDNNELITRKEKQIEGLKQELSDLISEKSKLESTKSDKTSYIDRFIASQELLDLSKRQEYIGIQLKIAITEVDILRASKPKLQAVLQTELDGYIKQLRDLIPPTPQINHQETRQQLISIEFQKGFETLGRLNAKIADLDTGLQTERTKISDSITSKKGSINLENIKSSFNKMYSNYKSKFMLLVTQVQTLSSISDKLATLEQQLTQRLKTGELTPQQTYEASIKLETIIRFKENINKNIEGISEQINKHQIHMVEYISGIERSIEGQKGKDLEGLRTHLDKLKVDCAQQFKETINTLDSLRLRKVPDQSKKVEHEKQQAREQTAKGQVLVQGM